MERIGRWTGLVLVLSLLVLVISCACTSNSGADDESAQGTSAAEETHQLLRRGTGQHTDNWAVLICTSRFWFNYRHVANTLAVYRMVKRLGMPDSHIILMLADDMACNPRNSEPGAVYSDDERGDGDDLYGDDIEVDYKGYEVTVESFTRVLTGRHPEGTPPSKRLQTTERSNVLIYMTGHGGDEFIKFQDAEEISSRDLADSFAQMWQKRRYNEIFFLSDTCQAGTLANHVYSPHILAVGSAAKGENSYSYGHSSVLGVSLVDRFTYKVLEILDNVSIGSSARLFKGTCRACVCERVCVCVCLRLARMHGNIFIPTLHLTELILHCKLSTSGSPPDALYPESPAPRPNPKCPLPTPDPGS